MLRLLEWYGDILNHAATFTNHAATFTHRAATFTYRAATFKHRATTLTLCRAACSSTPRLLCTNGPQ